MRHGVRTTWRIRATVFAVACSAAYLHLDTPIAFGVGPLFVAGLLAFIAANMVSAACRILLGHWQVPGLLGALELELGLGVGIPAAIVASLHDWPGSYVALGLVAAALFLLHGDYVELQVTIAESVRASGRRTLGDWVRSRPAPSGPNTSRLVGDVHDFKKEPIGRVWLAARLTDPRERGLSFMRLALFWLIASGFWIGADAAATQVVHQYLAPASIVKEEGIGRGGRPKGEEAGGASPSSGVGQEGSGEDTAASGPACPTETPAGAPRWARHDLRALYLGGLEGEATAPPGFRFGGCPGRAIVPPRLGGSFVYAIGWRPDGKIGSLVVDSNEFGAEIFLAPAAQQVLALIRRGVMPVGGHPRLFPYGGDVVTVTTPSGTIALVRAEEHDPGHEDVAAPYVELPATVATAWLGAMGEAEEWLWPSPPRSVGGREEYGLVGLAGGAPLYEISYDRRSGGATRDIYSYTRPETPLGYLELKAWAEPGGSG